MHESFQENSSNNNVNTSVPLENLEASKRESDLHSRSVKGVFWVISVRFSTQFLGFIKSLFIVHYFLLNDLGIISAAIMLIEILTSFTQTGFETALIQKKDSVADYLDTVWVAGIIKGILLFLFLYYAAPLLSSFKIPDEKISLATWVFRAMSLLFLIRGFRNIGIIFFSKDLDFHKTFTLSTVSALMDIVLTICLVLLFRSIWGVITARVVTAVLECAGTYILSPYRPRLRFEMSKARELWKFGRWIFGGNILGFLISEGDDFFVWFYLGINPLALYRYAFRFSSLPGTHISNVVSQVSFPAYSKIQNDLQRLRNAYFKVLRMTALVSVPSAFLIFVLGPDFVRIFLPERMYPMILTLQILALKGLMASISSTYGPVFKAIGKPNIIWYITLICLVILGITIYPFTKRWGIAGTALSTVLFGVLANPFYLFLLCRNLQCSISEVFRLLTIPLVASFLSSAAVLILKYLYFENSTLFSFFILAAVYCFIYSSLTLIIDRLLNLGTTNFLGEQIRLLIKDRE